MIKQIIRISYRPFQMIFDGIRRRRAQRVMMAYVLKIENHLTNSAMVKG